MLPADQWGFCFWLLSVIEGTRTPVLLWSSSTKTERRGWIQVLHDWLIAIVQHGGSSERFRWLEPVIHCFGLALQATVGTGSINHLRASFEAEPVWCRTGATWELPQSLSSLNPEECARNVAAAEVAADLHQLAGEDSEIHIEFAMRSVLNLCHDIDWILTAQRPPSSPARGASDTFEVGRSRNVRPRFY